MKLNSGKKENLNYKCKCFHIAEQLLRAHTQRFITFKSFLYEKWFQTGS